jgi:PBSX family phage terminase large subunit
MALSRKAWDYLNAKPKRVNLLHGSVRSSKTVNSMLGLPKRIANAPRNGEVVFTGKTERTLYRNVISPLIKMYGSRRVKYSKGSGEGRFGNRTFFAIGAHNESAEDNVRGLTCAYWLADEVVTYPEVVTDMLLSRLSLEASVGDLTCNPGPPGHYINQKIILPTLAKERDDAAVWHFLLEDNPNLPQNYLEFLKNQYPLGSLFYKRNILGLWVLAEGTVYDFFDTNTHVLKEEPQQEPDFIDLACDYGTANPLVVGAFWGWEKPLSTGLRVLLKRGFYYDSRKVQIQLTDSEYADKIDEEFAEEKLRHRCFIVDPSAASFILELRKRGWNVKQANNDVLDGIKTQAKLLKSGAFALGKDSSLKPFIDEYGAYLWDEKAQAKGEDKPMKQNDHSLDATRYLLHTLYRKESIGWVSQ